MTQSIFINAPYRLASYFSLIALTAASSQAAVIQTNYGTGDNTVPGPPVSTSDLLQTHLSSASRTGEIGVGNNSFYREDSGYTVDLSRLYNGTFGIGGTSAASSVLPNKVTLTFAFDLLRQPEGYSITTIRTYAGWDSGRDGQAYIVEYSTAAQPETFQPLATVARFDNTTFPMVLGYVYDDETGAFSEEWVEDEDHSHTLVELNSETGDLASNVAQLRFIFDGVENGGTAYREIDVIGSAIPEPTTFNIAIASLALCLTRRRRH